MVLSVPFSRHWIQVGADANSMSQWLPFLRSSMTSLGQAQQVHAHILVLGHAHAHNHLLSKVVDLRSLAYAVAVFRHIPFPDDFSYTCMIRAYAAAGHPHQSLCLYSELLGGGLRPSNLTYPFVLKACSALSAAVLGRQVHAHVLKLGFGDDVFVGNSLVDMYCKCFQPDAAWKMFDEMPARDVVSWNSIVSGYVFCGWMGRAFELFEEMPMRRNVVCWTAVINGFGKEGMIADAVSLFRWMLVSVDDVRPNSATMVSLLSACSITSNWEVGRWVSTFIDVNAMPLDVMLSTALIDMHSKCGELEKARRYFNEAPEKNLVSWNAMITGYVQGGFPESAVQLFSDMKSASLVPNQITLVNLLSAFASMGALELGTEAHIHLARNGMEINVFLATALVNMYSKCGAIAHACLVFVKTSDKDLGLWNAMVTGLAAHGNGNDVLTIFSQMERTGMRPNEITFIGVLSACSHSGLVEAGRENFCKMSEVYGLNAQLEHYSCMVDLLGRAGHVDEALALVQHMETSPDWVIWGSLLNASRIHHDIKLANEISQIIFSSREPNLGCSVLLSNIFASAGMWADVVRVRRLIKETGVRKLSGCSWIEIEGIVHRFLVEDTIHGKSHEMYWMLTRLMEEVSMEGIEQEFEFVLPILLDNG